MCVLLIDFLRTSDSLSVVDLKSMQAENSRCVIPPTSRSSNYIALRFCDSPLQNGGAIERSVSCYRYMVVFQYVQQSYSKCGDHEVISTCRLVRRHTICNLLVLNCFYELKFLCSTQWISTEDVAQYQDFQVVSGEYYMMVVRPKKEEGGVLTWMSMLEGGPDYIVLKNLDTDSIRVISSVLGQSIALDYFVSQVDGMVEEFAEINRGMEKTGTFTMDRKKLFQLVGKANSNLADVILKVGLFERSEIAWRDAKYAQILDYLREEYEVTQRFGNLDFKLKFVEHNIHFLQEVLQNRKSDLLEWCIIVLLSIENVISVCEIVRGSIGTSI
ncbi:Sporulation protein RMD1 [Sesamum angolense]|uniref:Sporulation protein RMD1 n=1 Tax=Sesamum angolense TaxID=2727404 RepID=A0AAE1WUD1_9LAMI|nr:Sporulation protein RMD1 [Sesamum angolense]